MSHEPFKTDLFCVGGCSSSTSVNAEGGLTEFRENFLARLCMKTSRNQSMALNHHTTRIERLRHLVEIVRGASAQAGRKRIQM